MDFQKLNYEQIEDWCFTNGKEDWLEEQLEANTPFIQLKRNFAKKFMPEIIPTAQPKKPTMLDRFKARKGAKK